MSTEYPGPRLKESFERWYRPRRDAVARRLMEYIEIPTVTPDEHAASEFLTDYLSTVGADLEPVACAPALNQHPAWSPHGQSSTGPDRGSWRSTLGEGTSGTRTLFNAHVDVVPPSPDFPDAFRPRRVDDMVIGRGACDTKNNLIMLVEAVRFLRDEGIPLSRTAVLDLPIEEEIGGNGTLSLALQAPDVDEAVCLEPTSLQVLRGHRGCLSFRVDVHGRSVHMGSTHSGLDAIAGALEVIDRLRDLERHLLQQARTEPGFEDVPFPLQLNVGMISGGEWSGSVAERCSIWADVGFMPTTSLLELERQVEQACRSIPTREMAETLTIRTDVGLRNDAYLTDATEPVVTDLVSAISRHSLRPEPPRGWHVSCDARIYQKVAGLPTAIFGSGTLADAHSPHEQVSLTELGNGIAILAGFLSSPPGLA
ncbi:M20 family metallopeptidase [Nocardia brevicatena]|uniref:M20 family metallopeptidase n=1 Tax=Nocardia brevicatena TaxID=37327 RepID=UPI0005940D1C|nr:M20/M25/M40 family metallo-hydrolase [Nocardia brevicatena]